MSRETNMTVGRPTKLILGLAVPLILTNVGQQLYTVADASIVGRGVGVEALAALGATDWLYWLVLWTVQAMTQGFSVLVSQTFGSNDKKGLRKAITMSVLLCAAVGILLTVVFVSSAGWLLHLLDTPENIYDGAHIYLTMMYAGTLITMAYNMAAAILRALGDGKSPLIAMFTAGCLNIVLDLLFVIRFGWGIPGAAAATLLAQLFAFAYCVIALRKIPAASVEKPDWQPGHQCDPATVPPWSAACAAAFCHRHQRHHHAGGYQHLRLCIPRGFYRDQQAARSDGLLRVRVRLRRLDLHRPELGRKPA